MTAALDPPAEGAAEQLVDACARHGARLVRAVHARRAGEVAVLLDTVPDGRLDALVVALAGMVDHRRHVGELLAWTEFATQQQAPPGHGTARGYRDHTKNGAPACTPCLIAYRMSKRPEPCRAEYRRLRDLGVGYEPAFELSRPEHVLSRHPRGDTQ